MDQDSIDTISNKRSKMDIRHTEKILSERRDSIVEEMNKKFNIRKRKHDAVIKLRKMNSVAKALLDGQITAINTSFERQERQLNKEARNIQNELQKLRPARYTLPPIQKANEPSPSNSAVLCESSANNVTCTQCKFGTFKTGCKNFPCVIPVTYTSMSDGHEVCPRSYAKQDQQIKKEKREQSNAEANEKHHRPRISVEDRERGLRQLVHEMRERNERRKPKDWATNYGDPVPKRILLKPVILSRHPVL